MWQKNYQIKIKPNKLLKVSFFEDIYSDYKILFVDDDYKYSLVGGQSPNYLWILSRTPFYDHKIMDNLLKIAKENGYNIENILSR